MKLFLLERQKEYSSESLSVQIWPVPIFCQDDSVIFLNQISCQHLKIEVFTYNTDGLVNQFQKQEAGRKN